MITVPQGFVMIEQGPLTLMLRRDYREQLLGLGLGDPERLCAQQTGTFARTRTYQPSTFRTRPSPAATLRRLPSAQAARISNIERRMSNDEGKEPTTNLNSVRRRHSSVHGESVS